MATGENAPIVADDTVVAGATGDPVVAPATDQVVVLAFTEQHVATSHAVDEIVTRLAMDLVRAADVVGSSRIEAHAARRVVEQLRRTRNDPDGACVVVVGERQ